MGGRFLLRARSKVGIERQHMEFMSSDPNNFFNCLTIVADKHFRDRRLAVNASVHHFFCHIKLAAGGSEIVFRQTLVIMVSLQKK